MNHRRIFCRLVALTGLLVAAAAPAQPLTCPAPGALMQVATCLPPAQLRYEYIGYCSDNRRMYGGGSEACTSFEHYVRSRHSVLWESPDGLFQGYLSCSLSGASLAELPPPTMDVRRQGAVTRVVCSYGKAATMTHRTRARCVLHDAAACAADPTACQARCD